MKPARLPVDIVREVCDEWRYVWNLPPEVDKIFGWAVGHDVGISNARFEKREWADAFMAIPMLVQHIDRLEAVVAALPKLDHGDLRSLKAIRGMVQASLGPETTSDELALLDRLIDAVRAKEESGQ